jgi:hypothetical protein
MMILLLTTTVRGQKKDCGDLRGEEVEERYVELFLRKVEISRIRMGRNQEIETLINEETLLFAQCLRNEKKEWNPGILQTL